MKIKWLSAAAVIPSICASAITINSPKQETALPDDKETWEKQFQKYKGEGAYRSFPFREEINSWEDLRNNCLEQEVITKNKDHLDYFEAIAIFKQWCSF